MFSVPAGPFALLSPAQCQGGGLCGLLRPLASHWVQSMKESTGRSSLRREDEIRVFIFPVSSLGRDH